MATREMSMNYVKGTAGLVLFMLLISGGYMGQLLPCGTQKLFTENMYAKHLIGIFSVIFFISSSEIVTNEIKFTPTQTISFSLILYSLFVISNKSGVYTNMILFGALLFISLLQMYVSHYEHQLKDEKNNSEERQQLHVNIDSLTKLQHRILLGTLCIVLVGFLAYGYDKYKEYGSNFSVLDFVVGISRCKNVA